MPIQQGGNSYFLAGLQSARGVQTPWGSFNDSIYQFTSGGLQAQADFATVPANKGNFSPTPTLIGQVGSGGSITVPQTADKFGFWLTLCQHNTTITRTQCITAAYDLVATAARSNNTAISGPAETAVSNTALQPKYRLPSPQYTASNPNLNAARVTVEVTDATWVVAAGGSSFDIVGTDQSGVTLTDTIEIARGDTGVNNSTGAVANNTGFVSTRYFATVDTVTPRGFTTAGNAKLAIDATEYARHVINVGNSLLNGTTFEMVKGNIPNVYIDQHVSEWTFTPGDVNQLAMTYLGGAAKPRTNAQNAGTSASSLTGKTRGSAAAAPGYASIFRFNDDVIRFGEGSVTCNHSLGADENSWAHDRNRPAPVQTANREVSLTARISYPGQIVNVGSADTDQAIDTLAGYTYGDNVSVSMEGFIFDWGSAVNILRFELPNGRLSSFPDPADIAQGQISNPIEVAGHGEGTTTDLRITAWNNLTAAQFNA